MRFFRSEDGQGLVEYVLVLILVGVVLIAVLALLGPFIPGFFNDFFDTLRQFFSRSG
jgi:pilus assembly protein Flp/PilA